MSRVVKSPGAIYGEPRRCGKRRRCDGHLTDVHMIEPGQWLIWSALPPDTDDIGNPGWLHAAFCEACWPDDIVHPDPWRDRDDLNQQVSGGSDE